jgi:hypothetical protein
VNPYTAYAFTPVASDADNDALSFQIANKPAWATFSTITGALTGTPTTAHEGAYPNIEISVSDGKASAALPAFSINVVQAVIDGNTLYWTLPTENVDGTPLTDLAGFTIAYGPSATMLHTSVRVANPSVNSYSLEKLPAGTYHFAVSAYTSTGAQSAFSPTVSKVIS